MKTIQNVFASHMHHKGVWKKRFFWAYKLGSKYEVTWHARNAPTKNGGSTLWFGPHRRAPKGQWPPIIRVKSSKLSYRAYRMPIRKPLRQTDLKRTKMLYLQYFFEIFTWKETTIPAILFFACIFQSICSGVLWIAQVWFSRQELSNKHTMSFVRQF